MQLRWPRKQKAMARKRDGFVLLGDVAGAVELPGRRGLTHRAAAPPARRHFTRLDQVTQLVGASEADADLGFMARLLALCTLPRTNPGNRLQYKRVNGPYKLVMVAGADNKLPFGNLPRLLLAWVSTEAVRTQSRVLVLGDSLSEFMRKLDLYSTSGRGHTRLRNQMDRLFNASVSLVYEEPHGRKATINSHVADRTDFWWSETRPDDRSLWESKIELGEKFFEEVIRNPVPARPAHLEVPQSVIARARPLPVADLSHVRAQGSDAAVMEGALSAVSARTRPRRAMRAPLTTSARTV